MRVLLIQPSASEHPNAQPPLGLAYLGAVLEQRGCDVSLLDAHAPRACYSNNDLLELAREFRPDL